jgi:acetyl esterase
LALDPKIAAYLQELRELGGPPLWEQPVRAVRLMTDSRADELFGAADPVAAVSDTTASGVPVRIYVPTATPEAPPTEGAVVYFHGGGWVIGSLRSHDRLCRTLAARTRVPLIAVDYRLAPEHPFPAAIEDAWAVTQWAARRYDRVIVAGDSAGGQLATSVALRARDAGLRLALQALVYPVTDHAFDTGSYREFTDPLSLNEATMRWFWDHYLSGGAAGETRDHSPLRAVELTGVAPALLITAGADPLRDEAEAYAERLRAAGVAVQLHRYEGMIHGFIRMAAIVDQAGEAIDQVADAVRRACGVDPPLAPVSHPAPVT